MATHALVRLRLGPLEVALPDGKARDGELVLGIRPHEVELGRGVALPIRSVERLGAETHVRLALGEQELVAVAPGERELPGAGTLAVELPARALHFFDPRSGARI